MLEVHCQQQASEPFNIVAGLRCLVSAVQVQEAYDTWRQAGKRVEQLGLQAQHHCRWRSCQRAFEVRSCLPALAAEQHLACLLRVMCNKSLLEDARPPPAGQCAGIV